MLTSFIATLALLTAASVSGSPTIYDKRDPQFMVNLPNRLPVNGSIGFGITIEPILKGGGMTPSCSIFMS